MARPMYGSPVMESVLRVGLVVLAMTGTAAAQPGTMTPAAPMAAPAPAAEPVRDGTAIVISVGGTLASWVLLSGALSEHTGSYRGPLAVVGVLGTVLAPSFGHWYAGSRPVRGLALRVAGFTTLIGGGIMVATECEDGCAGWVAGALLLGGAGLYLAGTIDDVVRLPGAVRRYNAGLRSVTLAPMVQRDGAGVMIAGRF